MLGERLDNSLMSYACFALCVPVFQCVDVCDNWGRKVSRFKYAFTTVY